MKKGDKDSKQLPVDKTDDKKDDKTKQGYVSPVVHLPNGRIGFDTLVV